MGRCSAVGNLILVRSGVDSWSYSCPACKPCQFLNVLLRRNDCGSVPVFLNATSGHAYQSRRWRPALPKYPGPCASSFVLTPGPASNCVRRTPSCRRPLGGGNILRGCTSVGYREHQLTPSSFSLAHPRQRTTPPCTTRTDITLIRFSSLPIKHFHRRRTPAALDITRHARLQSVRRHERGRSGRNVCEHEQRSPNHLELQFFIGGCER